MNDQETPLPSGTDPRRWIHMRRRLNAPPDRTFRAWADPDQPGGFDAWAKALESWTEALTMLRAHLDFSVDLRQRR